MSRKLRMLCDGSRGRCGVGIGPIRAYPSAHVQQRNDLASHECPRARASRPDPVRRRSPTGKRAVGRRRSRQRLRTTTAARRNPTGNPSSIARPTEPRLIASCVGGALLIYSPNNFSWEKTHETSASGVGPFYLCCWGRWLSLLDVDLHVVVQVRRRPSTTSWPNVGRVSGRRPPARARGTARAADRR